MMVQRCDFEELRQQAGEMRGNIPGDLVTRPNTQLNDYYEELQRRYAPEAVRTALWDLIADQTLLLQHPGNIIMVNTH